MPARVGSSLRAYGRLFSDRLFVIMVVVAGLMFATLFAYISGSPFILQELYHLTPQQFGVAFSANAVGMIVMTQLNPLFVKRWGPARVLTVAVVVSFLAAVALLVVAGTDTGGLVGLMIPLWVLVASAGLSFPNAPAIALNRHGDSAGTASAMLGAAQFMIGGFVAPLVGALADGTPVPMAGVMVGTTGLAVLLVLTVRRSLNAVDYSE
jgi:DHA1 family bicyclomycin/chloramphenicol resistance-like MFS transporter